MNPGIRAYVTRDPDNYLWEMVRLFVVDKTYTSVRVLCSDGTWTEAKEGATVENAGLLLPVEAVEAIAQAIEKFQGHASHADTEARVLREWLAVESARVDKAMAR